MGAENRAVSARSCGRAVNRRCGVETDVNPPTRARVLSCVNAVLTLALLAADLTPAQIDRMVRAEWRKHDVTPAARASDAAFLRRVWLDLAGTLPPVDDIKKFLADPARDKRA